MKTFMTGASGFVGSHLLDALANAGSVVALSRRPRSSTHDNVRWIVGNPQDVDIWTREIRGVNAVVHLAGEPIFGSRWNTNLRERVVSSRIIGTRNLVDALGDIEADDRPRALLCASSYGYYGLREGVRQDESALPGETFLSKLSAQWEAEAERASSLGVRVVALRFGLVLRQGEGALANMVPAFRMFVGGPVGNGRQYVPWIHHRDVVGLILHALGDNRVRGPLNVVAPEAVTMRSFAAELGRTLRRPSWLGLPAFIARTKHGEAADALLAGANVVPDVALSTGYKFQFPSLREALNDLLGGGHS